MTSKAFILGVTFLKMGLLRSGLNTLVVAFQASLCVFQVGWGKRGGFLNKHCLLISIHSFKLWPLSSDSLNQEVETAQLTLIMTVADSADFCIGVFKSCPFTKWSCYLFQPLLPSAYLTLAINQWHHSPLLQACEAAGGKCVTHMDGYYVEMGICVAFGLFWLLWQRRKIHRLQALPESAWKTGQ